MHTDYLDKLVHVQQLHKGEHMHNPYIKKMV